MQRHCVNIHMCIYPRILCNEPGCSRIFTKIRDLNDHNRLKHGADKLKCNDCDETFDYARDLYYHKQSKQLCLQFSSMWSVICFQSVSSTSHRQRSFTQWHSLIISQFSVFSRQLEAALNGDESTLEAGRKDAEFINLLCADESDHNSGTYFLHESLVKRFEFTAESVNQMNYAGKYTEQQPDKENRPKRHAIQFKKFVENVSSLFNV